MSSGVEARLIEGRRVMRRELRAYAVGMGGLAVFLLAAKIFCGPYCGLDTAYWISAIALVVLSILSGRAFLRLVRYDVSMLWTPAALYPLSTLLFFGFGSSSTLIADDATILFLFSGNYAIDANGLMRTTLLTSTGVAVLATAFVLSLSVRIGDLRNPAESRYNMSLPTTALFFVVSGATLKYGLVVPQEFGLIGGTIPGSLKSLTGLLDLGLAVMAYMAARGRKMWGLVFFIIWPLHLVISALEFSKLVTMFAILLPAAGAYLGHQNWKRLMPWIIFAVVVYSYQQNINTTARITMRQNSNAIGAASLQERLDILEPILAGNLRLSDLTTTAQSAAQVWWLRLNYSGAQLRAMELYDNGQSAQWTLSLAETVIPRFLWPGKPESPAVGRTFNRIVSGNSEARARVGMSIYADGYWQMGWKGLFMFSAIAGVILGFVTRINYRAILERKFIYLPVILLGMRMAATGPVGILQKSFIGTMPIFLGYLFILYIVLNATPKRRKLETGPASDRPEAAGVQSMG